MMVDEQALADLGAHVERALAGEVSGTEIRLGELMVAARAEQIVKVLTFLRDDALCQFKILIDICGVDYPERAERFDVVYNLLSLRLNQRIRVKVKVDEEGVVPERHGGLQRGQLVRARGLGPLRHPFRRSPGPPPAFDGLRFRGPSAQKGLPLTGYVEMRYDDEQKRVVYEPVKLTQEFRSFDFLSPWEGAEYILPGDEKAEEKT